MEVEHEKFPVDARRTPGGILRNHQEDQFTDLLGDSPSTADPFLHFAEDGPVQFESSPGCHRATLSGRTRKSDFSQSDQRWRTTTQNSLSNAPSLGLGCLRFNTASCSSGVTAKPANGGHFKTGQRKWPGTRLFYSDASCGGKSVFVRQLRGPHLST